MITEIDVASLKMAEDVFSYWKSLKSSNKSIQIKAKLQVAIGNAIAEALREAK